MNLRLSSKSGAGPGALGASSVGLSDCGTFCSWLVISKRGHGVPPPAVISEALPLTHT